MQRRLREVGLDLSARLHPAGQPSDDDGRAVQIDRQTVAGESQSCLGAVHLGVERGRGVRLDVDCRVLQRDPRQRDAYAATGGFATGSVRPKLERARDSERTPLVGVECDVGARAGQLGNIDGDLPVAGHPGANEGPRRYPGAGPLDAEQGPAARVGHVRIDALDVGQAESADAVDRYAPDERAREDAVDLRGHEATDLRKAERERSAGEDERQAHHSPRHRARDAARPGHGQKDSPIPNATAIGSTLKSGGGSPNVASYFVGSLWPRIWSPGIRYPMSSRIGTTDVS